MHNRYKLYEEFRRMETLEALKRMRQVKLDKPATVE